MDGCSVTDDRIERDRQAALAGYDLDELTDLPDLRTIVRMATCICRVPMGAVHIITDTRQRRLATVGMGNTETAREHSMCDISIRQPGQVVVSDAREDPRYAANPFVTGALGHVRFYAASLLRPAGEPVLGTLCIFDTTVRTLTEQQQQELDDLAALVVNVFELHRRTRLLVGALETLQLTGRELERSNTVLAGFAHQVSHDLRNPLQVVSGFLTHLLELPLVRANAEAADCAARAAASADRMRSVIDSVLGEAAIGGRPRIGQVDLSSVVHETLDDLEPEVRAARGKVAVGPLPTVAGDAAQLRTVLQNLIDNALKYRHPDRPCRVQITAEQQPTGHIIHIADNGIGIPVEQRQAALRLFTRLNEETSGHGIGLATCCRIIEAHQGRISLTETPGGGTTVSIELPTPAE